MSSTVKRSALTRNSLSLCAAFFWSLAAATGCTTPNEGSVRYLEQNWSDEVRKEWWFTSQGSRIIPYDWFMALERADSAEAFSSDGNMKRLRFIPGPKDPALNPDGLPIGFVADEQHIGVTCAACHTGQFEYNGTRVIVDGGPAHGDFDRMITEMAEALQATLKDEGKFKRFSDTVLVAGHDAADADALKDEVAAVSDAFSTRVERNRPPHPNGYGRLDAFGNIFNEVTVAAIGEPANRKLADAPVAYPVLWDTPQHDAVQWDGSALNAGIGPYIRNAGEVVGVFGDARIEKSDGGASLTYSHHIDFEGLKRLEEMLVTLWSPQWPEEILPAVDPAKAARGKAHFMDRCSDCHHDIDRADPERRVKQVVTPLEEIGTDPFMVTNKRERRSMTGLLQGSPKTPLRPEPVFGAEALSVELVVNTVLGILVQDLPKTIGPQEFGMGLQAFGQARAERAAAGGLQAGYKARPLNGIWASAPFLHNDSVPNLWELLKKPAQRTKTFNVGSWKFDPKHVGYATDPGPLISEFDATVDGNSNLGHDYGTELSDTEKWELIEYIKTL